jgi:hypothetical protein
VFIDHPVFESEIISDSRYRILPIFLSLESSDQRGLAYFALPDKAYFNKLIDILGGMFLLQNGIKRVIDIRLGLIDNCLTDGTLQHLIATGLTKGVAALVDGGLADGRVESQIAFRALHRIYLIPYQKLYIVLKTHAFSHQ